MKIFDMHCNTIENIYHTSSQLYQNDLAIDLNKLIKGQVMGQCFAIFVPFNLNNLYNTCLDMINTFKKEINKNSNLIEQAFNYQDILEINKKNKIVAILTIEEGNVIENDLSRLQYLYDLGVRMITLTWNYKNNIGCPSIINQEKGLTKFGIKMIQEMNRLGIIIDVSHLSDKGVEDVLKYSSKPFVASHSNARTICNHPRNLSDKLIKKLAKRKCVIGINFYQNFVTKDKDNYIDKIVEHILHIVSIGGIDCVGFGSDFDGMDANKELQHPEDVNKIINKLISKGFSNEDIEKICYKNVLRIFKENMK